MKNYYGELRGCLESQFYADNFEHIYSVSYEAAGAVDRPLFFVLLWSIFHSLDERWRQRPFHVTVARQMEQQLRPPILAYLDAAARPMPMEEELNLLNRIAAAFRGWQEIEAQILYGDRPGR